MIAALLILLGAAGCRQLPGEGRMLQDPPFIEGHEPPEIAPERVRIETHHEPGRIRTAAFPVITG